MAPQNDRAIYAFNLLFEYIAYLKQENAELSAENAAKAETIVAKEMEAMEVKTMYETYVNADEDDDSALEQIIAKAEADLSLLKS
ncbi:hypothetical protein [Brunnivagina elsteri]|uniref:Uncharacterized protein n=1 Tax=Brunnivagina elsteri CCALA 953 TaxID=987040 RepID=A0A2A2TAH2_9CYAN|nr:hypothetical protein [Calothrix elsteri]PAX48296.1 hypothetical protein CK510_28315 [Calothrix elsteri CCALA 953]